MEIGNFKCKYCNGEFELFIIRDPRQYVPYYFNCVYCGAKIPSGFKQEML